MRPAAPVPAVRTLLTAVLLTLAPLATARGGEVAGRLLDAAESTQSFRSGQARGEDWFVPLAEREATITLLPGGEKSVTVQTDAEGRFRASLGEGAFPAGARCVARVAGEGPPLFSPSFAPGEDADVFLYRTTESGEDVSCEFGVVHDVEERGDDVWLRVRIQVSITNMGDGLYVGERQGSAWREVFRVPVPEGAEILRNEGPVSGLRWTRSEDGGWLVIDEPVPGFPDLARLLRRRERWAWSLEYVVPGRQRHGFHYPIDLRCGRLALYGEKDVVKVVGPPGRLASPVTIDQDPMTGARRKYEAWGMSGDEIAAGTELPLVLRIDNAALGEVSDRAIKWHGGFVVLALVAVLLGFLLGPRRRRPEELLEGLDPDAALDRIALLDRRREEGLVREAEYRRYREALVEIAAARLEGEGEGPAGEGAGPPVTGAAPPDRAALPEEAAELLKRIREIDAAEDGGADAVRERAHLLEALYQRLAKETGR